MDWDWHPDGNRVVMLDFPEDDTGGDGGSGVHRINIIVNWFEELKERVPVP